MRNWKASVAVGLLLPFVVTVVVLAQTQGDLNQRACNEYKRADAELNKLYERILSENRADTVFVRKMRAAQRAWVSYRDAHLESLYPAADKREYGSVHPMCHCMSLTEITKKRTNELRRWVQGVPEGEVCAGSIKIRDVK